MAGGGGGNYSNHSLLLTQSPWIAKNNFNGEIPKVLPKEQVEFISKSLLSKYKATNVKLYLTNRCNYTCPMCPYHGDGYLNGKFFADNSELKQDMPYERVVEIVDKVVEYGLKRILLSAPGEALMHPRILDIIAYCKSKGLYVVLTSNGALMSADKVKLLREAGLDEMDISIDSVTEESYKQVRSAKEGNYKTAIFAPILAKKSGMHVSVSYVEQEANKGEFENLFEFYSKEGINNIRKGFQCDLSEKGIVRRGRGYKGEYIHGLCMYYTVLVLVDGTLISCCSMEGFLKEIKDKLPNIFKCKNFDEAVEKLYDFMANDAYMYHKCKQCETYIPNATNMRKMQVENGFVKISGFTNAIYVNVPKQLKGLPDDILHYLYKKHWVTQMKIDGLFKGDQ